MERINKCAQEGSDVKFLLVANLLISVMAFGMALGIQGFRIYKAWKGQKSTTYEVEIKAKKRVVLDENANQPDLESLETPEEDPSYVGQPSIQPEVPDLGFGQDSPRVDEVGLLKLTTFQFVLIYNDYIVVIYFCSNWTIFRGFLFIYILMHPIYQKY